MQIKQRWVIRQPVFWAKKLETTCTTKKQENLNWKWQVSKLVSQPCLSSGTKTLMASKELDTAFYDFEWAAWIQKIGFRKCGNKIMKL